MTGCRKNFAVSKIQIEDDLICDYMMSSKSEDDYESIGNKNVSLANGFNVVLQLPPRLCSMERIMVLKTQLI